MRLYGLMGRALIMAACLGPRALGAQGIDSNTVRGVTGFLEVYQALSQGHSAFFYELYSDRAQIFAQTPGGAAPIVFRGVNYKAWGKELISRVQAYPDASRFDSLKIERRASRLYVHAHRYSLSRCYLDQGYSLTLEPFGAGYRILEEHLTLQPLARCAQDDRSAALAPGLSSLAAPPPRAPWRPMSAEDINATALRIAEQMGRASAQSNVSRGASVSAPIEFSGNASELWVPPPEPR